MSSASSSITVTAQNPSPQQDAHFSKLTVQSTSTRGVPPRDLLVQNLTVGERDYSFGDVPRDANFSNLAVVQTVSGRVTGNGTRLVGRV